MTSLFTNEKRASRNVFRVWSDVTDILSNDSAGDNMLFQWKSYPVNNSFGLCVYIMTNTLLAQTAFNTE